MTLTAAEVHGTQFRVVFRGYDIAAVDAFLDQVETELSRQTGTVSVGSRGSGATPQPTTAGAGRNGRHSHEAGTSDAATGPSGLSPAIGHAAEEGSERGESDVSARAVRTLRMAEQMADQLVAAAGAEADQLQAQARDEAATLLAKAQATANATLSEATASAESMIAEAGRASEAALQAARSEASATLSAARAEATRIVSQAEELSRRVEADLAARRQQETSDLARETSDLREEAARLDALQNRYRDALAALLADTRALLERSGS